MKTYEMVLEVWPKQGASEMDEVQMHEIWNTIYHELLKRGYRTMSVSTFEHALKEKSAAAGH